MPPAPRHIVVAPSPHGGRRSPRVRLVGTAVDETSHIGDQREWLGHQATAVADDGGSVQPPIQVGQHREEVQSMDLVDWPLDSWSMGSRVAERARPPEAGWRNPAARGLWTQLNAPSSWPPRPAADTRAQQRTDAAPDGARGDRSVAGPIASPAHHSHRDPPTPTPRSGRRRRASAVRSRPTAPGGSTARLPRRQRQDRRLGRRGGGGCPQPPVWRALGRAARRSWMQ